jgi:hypothetical protein
MKRLFIILVLTGSIAACNNSGNSTAEKKDSLDSIANEKKEMIDSNAQQRKDEVDSATQLKKEAVEHRDSLREKDSAKKKEY